MSSSDSEDDSFLNIGQKLSAMKNNYRVDNIVPSQVNNSDNSVPVKATTSTPTKRKNAIKSPVKEKRRKSTDSGSSDSIDIDAFRSAFPSLIEAKPKRKTRAATKKKAAQGSPNLAESQTSLPRRRKTSDLATASTSTFEVAGNSSNSTRTPRNRGRGRGKGRGRGRGRRNRNSSDDGMIDGLLDILQSFIPSHIPTYSVGNTDEYPDQCDSQQLFGNKNKNNVVEAEDLNESLEDNEEMSVKVYWQSVDIFKFMIRKYQRFTVIFDYFAKKENVTHDRLLFTYNDKILKSEDTPETIDYSIVKFIEGGIVNQSVAHLPSDTQAHKDGVKLKFQCQNVKRPFETFVKPDEKLSIAMLQCAEHLEKSLDKLRFEFDGDIISGKSTARELELEGGECIDVKILS